MKLFEMIFDTVYLGTCISRLNVTKFDSIGCSIMRNGRVLISGFHVAHGAKCFSSCVYSYFSSTTDNFILSQKCQRLGCMSLK